MILKNKLDINNKDHKGLLAWVKDFLIANHHANVKSVKQIRANIDKKVKELNLDRNEVYFYYGDIDNPKEKKEVYKKIGIDK